MFPIATVGPGTCNAIAPDACRTPTPAGPQPMPYPNLAMLVQANKATCTKKVKILNQAALTKMSMVAASMLDEAGAAGGVVSGVVAGPAVPVMTSMKVKMEGAGVLYQGCQMKQNGINANCVGLQDAPSQTVVKVLG